MPMAYVLLWHERNSQAPGHLWLRNMICESVAKAVNQTEIEMLK
jgi:hypothetical protein